MSEILYRVFTCNQYLDDFVDGKLFMHSLKWYREHEDENVRGDADEGYNEIIVEPNIGSGMVWFHNYQTGVTERIPTPKIKIELNGKATHTFALCFTKTACEIYDDGMARINATAEDIKKFGNCGVFILNFPEFINRINRAIMDDSIKFSCASVQYVDFKEYFDDLTPFIKSKDYQWQNEYRITFLNENTNEDYFMLNIGIIKDIVAPFYIDPLTQNLIVN